MHTRLVHIALDKSRTPEERERLQVVVTAANALDGLEESFEQRMDANKALRGAKSSSLRGRRRKDLEDEAEDVASQVERDLKSMPSSRDVLRAVLLGMTTDIAFWSKASKHAHPSDLALVQELFEAKIKLRDALAGCLRELPP